MRAIVIDDSRATRAILKRILAELGFETLEAKDGQHALDVLHRDGPVDIALVDWNMPVMDGLSFVRAARADERFAGLVILMVTTEGGTDHLVEALQAGANEYVMKPFTADVIRQKLRLLHLPS